MTGRGQGTRGALPPCPHPSWGGQGTRGVPKLTHGGAGGVDEHARDGGAHEHGPARALDDGHGVERDLARPPPRVPGPSLVMVNHERAHQEARVLRGRACGDREATRARLTFPCRDMALLTRDIALPYRDTALSCHRGAFRCHNTSFYYHDTAFLYHDTTLPTAPIPTQHRDGATLLS